MNITAIAKGMLTSPKIRFFYLNKLGFYKHLPDEKFLKKAFRVKMGHDLDLENPKTFSEKLQWLKLHDRKDIYTTMADKYLVKDYVASKIGEEYIIPTLGVWNSFDEIDFDALPDKFVLKCTHDSGGLIICTKKAELDKHFARKRLTKCLNREFFYAGREWPYKNIKPAIIAEKYMEDSVTNDLRDYKFFAFDSNVQAMFIATERNSAGETRFDFFDADFNHLPFTNGHPNADVTPAKPENFELMKKLASELSAGIPQVRIDFYECDGKVYFGEFTFFHWGGMKPFDPEEWDYKFGEWIDLNGIE